MSALFPEGKKARKLVHHVYRLMHPYYWAESVAFHTFVYVKNTTDYIKGKYNTVALFIGCRRKSLKDEK
jgi:hypothetical protein